jgi:tRNA threonylcarbamoyladenosine biosynthesis protein TsaB
MSYILNIETATEVCSVCVADNKNIIFEREELKGPSHASILGRFVKEAVDFMRSEKLNLDAVAVSCGPGSYTGLRIGVSEAKGLCYGMNIPLIAINTLEIMAWHVIGQGLANNDSLLCPMIDARRMEVYDAIFNQKLEYIREINADIIDENSFSDILESNKITFFGNGATKIKDVMTHSNCIFIDGIHPNAISMSNLSQQAFDKKQFVDVAYFEPFYLKEFVATTPKNKVLPIK